MSRITEIGTKERLLRSLVRRMVVTATGVASWALRGHGDERGNFETFSVDIYPGIGFCARPPDGSEAKAVVVAIETSPNRPVIVATRDARTQKAIVEKAGLDANETLLHNADLIIKITREREVLLGLPGGDFQAVALADHTHKAPAISGQAAYTEPDARTGPPDKVSTHVKVT